MNLYDGCMYYNRSLLRLQEWLKLGTAFTENYQKNTQKLCFHDLCNQVILRRNSSCPDLGSPPVRFEMSKEVLEKPRHWDSKNIDLNEVKYITGCGYA
jgi:hypothetical protein